MDRDLSRSRAILISNATYRDPGIPDLPAASGCTSAMARLLTSELCGWPADRVESLQDVPAPHELARRIVNSVKDVQDVLLLYYVGHGMRTAAGQLALALRESSADPQLVPHTAILYEGMARILRGCPATTKLVILDCCHAELGNTANFQYQSADIDGEPVDGLYFIGASKKYEKAKSPLVGDLTYFTGAFIDVVRTGIPGRPPQLTIDQIFTELRGRMLRASLPEPVQSGIRDAQHWPFARNAARPESHRDLDQEIASLLEWKEAAETREKLLQAEVAERTAEMEHLREQVQQSESRSAGWQRQLQAELRKAHARLGDATTAQAAAQAESRKAAESVSLAITSEETRTADAQRPAPVTVLADLGARPEAGDTDEDAQPTHRGAYRDRFAVRRFRLNLGSGHAEPREVPASGPAPERPAGPARGGRDRRRSLQVGAVLAAALAAAVAIPLTIHSVDSNANTPDTHPSVRITTPTNRPTPTILEPPPSSTFRIPATDIPESVAFSTDGTLAIATSNVQQTDGTAYLWTPAMGNYLKPLHDSGSQGTYAAAFNPAGTVLAVGDSNGTIYLRHAASGNLIGGKAMSDPQSLGVVGLAFSPDNATLAVADANGSVYLWDPTTRTKLGTTALNSDSAGGDTVAFGPDNMVAVGGSDGNIYLYNALTRTYNMLADHGGSDVQALAFGKGGATLAAGDANGKIYLWAITPGASGTASGSLIRSFTDPQAVGVEAVAFSPNGATLAIGDKNHSAYLWDVATRKFTTRLHVSGETEGVSSVAFSPAGTALAVADHAGGAYLWHLTKSML